MLSTSTSTYVSSGLSTEIGYSSSTNTQAPTLCGATDMAPKFALKSEHRIDVDIDNSIFLSFREHHENWKEITNKHEWYGQIW